MSYLFSGTVTRYTSRRILDILDYRSSASGKQLGAALCSQIVVASKILFSRITESGVRCHVIHEEKIRVCGNGLPDCEQAHRPSSIALCLAQGRGNMP